MNISIPFKKKKINARIEFKQHDTDILMKKFWVILTHGASGDLNSPQLATISRYLSKQNFIVLRFTCKGLNIQYRVNVFSEVVGYIYKLYKPKGIFIGDRSMGARAAAMLTLKDKNSEICDIIVGIICLSYPLHKVNDSKLRSEPLELSEKPLFFLSGTKDKMCRKDLLENVLHSLKCPYKIYWLNGYDHSAKSNENFEEMEYTKALESLSEWCKNTSTI